MTGSRVLVLSEDHDGHSDRIVREVRARGGSTLLVDQTRLPEWTESVHLHGATGCEGWISDPSGETVDLDAIGAVAYWPAWIRLDLPGMELEPRMLVEDEWVGFLANLRSLLPGATWVNPLEPRLVGHPRLRQLQLAERLGLVVPETIVTNSLEEALRFVDAHPDGVASKRLTTIVRPYQGRRLRYGLYTRRVDRSTLEEAGATSIRYAPCLLQEYVPKEVEVRAYVLGDVVLSAEILSQDDPTTRDDWRAYPMVETPDGWDIDASRWKCRPATLPPEIERALVELVGKLGLAYSAVDLVRRPDGTYVFLEANHGGAWGWIQDRTGLPIVERLVDLLLGPRPGPS